MGVANKMPRKTQIELIRESINAVTGYPDISKAEAQILLREFDRKPGKKTTVHFSVLISSCQDCPFHQVEYDENGEHIRSCNIDYVSDNLTAPELHRQDSEVVPKECPIRGEPMVIQFEIMK
jgi:hypothetical protein